VLYDRLLSMARFAERPVTSEAKPAPRELPRFGPPRFRRNIPDWLEREARRGRES
jgi:hypothetical protein